MPELDLTPEQRDRVVTSLLDAFDERELDRVLRPLGARMDRIAGPGPLTNRFEDVVDAAERQGWTAELLEAVRAERPNRRDVQALASEFGAAPVNLGRTFERIVDPGRGIHDYGLFIEGMLAAEHRVCRIDVLNRAMGTGFLVGPDLVLTNYHVVATAHASGLNGASLQAVFGYKTARNGRSVDPGVAIPSAGDCFVAVSPPSPLDEQPYDPAHTPGVGELDYALLRLGSNRGLETRPDRDAPIGWFTLTDAVAPPAAQSWLVILQHAGGKQLQWDDGPVTLVNDAATRVQYSVNTEPGSSGSPCLDGNFDLVALHHSGDPSYSDQRPAGYNEGVPTATVFRSLPDQIRASLAPPPA